MNTTKENNSTYYQPAGFYLLRAPLLPATVFTHIATECVAQSISTPELASRLTMIRQQSYERLQAFLSDPLVEHALLVASADMLEGVAMLKKGKASPRRIERVYASLLRYLTRMSTRPTPFGLFAGIAVGSFAQSTTASIGATSVLRTRTRPDMDWLLSFIRHIEEDQALRPSLNVVANHTVYLAGEKAILPYADIYGQRDNRTITLRATSTVLHVLEQAKQPLPYTDLHRSLQHAFPTATTQQIDGLLQQLWDHHFLISDLRPPLTSANPEYYVLERLRSIPAAATLASSLQSVIDEAHHADKAHSEGAIQHIHQMTKHQQNLVPELTDHLFQLDTVLNLEHPHLHHAIGQAAAETIEILLRLSHPTQNRHHLYEYLTYFLEQYGPDAEVPLLDLLSPEVGLDAPPTYTEPARAYPLPSFPAPDTRGRDSLLCSLLAETLHMQRQEIELTDELLERLTQWKPDEYPLPPALELFIQIEASSKEALDRGEWRGLVAPTAASHGGRTFCRFFDIMGEKGIHALREYSQREEAFSPGTLFAELSYLPGVGRSANVAIRPALHDYEIVVNTTPSVPYENVIPLNDLVVGVRANRFYIRSLRHGKEVIVTQSHLLNPQFAPSICRFLLEVSHSRWSSLAGFNWGSAGNAPFLPRIVRKNIVLSPAQWNLFPSTVPLDEENEARFFEAVQSWRKQWHVPRLVYLKFFDNMLLLDLEHPLFLAELRNELRKAREQKNAVILQEGPSDLKNIWLCDKEQQPFFAELVVPVLAHMPSVRLNKAEQTKVSPRYPIPLLERRQLPGSDWTYLKLFAADKQHDQIIAEPLRSLACMLSEQGLSDRWFFIRYADPEPHLRIRFHASDEQQRQPLLHALLTWGQEVVHSGLANNLSLEAYDRETERYGGPDAIDIMETVFSANSQVVCTIIAALENQELHLEPLNIAVFTLDQLLTQWGYDFTQRLAYLQNQPLNVDERAAFRPRRQLLCELLQPWDTDYDASVQTQRQYLLQICQPQTPVLQRACTHIRALAEQNTLWMPEKQLLQSLSHMHLNRLLGIHPEQEKQIYAFWRYTLESLQRRPARKK